MSLESCARHLIAPETECFGVTSRIACHRPLAASTHLWVRLHSSHFQSARPLFSARLRTASGRHMSWHHTTCPSPPATFRHTTQGCMSGWVPGSVQAEHICRPTADIFSDGHVVPRLQASHSLGRWMHLRTTDTVPDCC